MPTFSIALFVCTLVLTNARESNTNEYAQSEPEIDCSHQPSLGVNALFSPRCAALRSCVVKADFEKDSASEYDAIRSPVTLSEDIQGQIGDAITRTLCMWDALLDGRCFPDLLHWATIHSRFRQV